jgi:hypothetical protein
MLGPRRDGRRLYRYRATRIRDASAAAANQPILLAVKADHSVIFSDDQVRVVKLARVATLWGCSRADRQTSFVSASGTPACVSDGSRTVGWRVRMKWVSGRNIEASEAADLLLNKSRISYGHRAIGFGVGRVLGK